MNKNQCKVCCDVCDCVHNEDGEVCLKEEIQVSNSQTEHCCASYKKRNN